MKTKKLKNWAQPEVEQGPDDLRYLIDRLRDIEIKTPCRAPLSWWGLTPFDLCELEEEGWIIPKRCKCRDGLTFTLSFTEEAERILDIIFQKDRKKGYFR